MRCGCAIDHDMDTHSEQRGRGVEVGRGRTITSFPSLLCQLSTSVMAKLQRAGVLGQHPQCRGQQNDAHSEQNGGDDEREGGGGCFGGGGSSESCRLPVVDDLCRRWPMSPRPDPIIPRHVGIVPLALPPWPPQRARPYLLLLPSSINVLCCRLLQVVTGRYNLLDCCV